MDSTDNILVAAVLIAMIIGITFVPVAWVVYLFWPNKRVPIWIMYAWIGTIALYFVDFFLRGDDQFFDWKLVANFLMLGVMVAQQWFYQIEDRKKEM